MMGAANTLSLVGDVMDTYNLILTYALTFRVLRTPNLAYMR